MKTLLAKFDKHGVCTTIYRFNYEININDYSGTEEIKDEKLKKEITIGSYKKNNDGIIKKIKDNNK